MRFLRILCALLLVTPLLYADSLTDPRVGLDRNDPGNSVIGSATMTSDTLGPQTISGITGASEFKVFNSTGHTLFNVFVTIDFLAPVTATDFTCDGHPTNWTCAKNVNSGSVSSLTWMFINTDTSGGNLADRGTPFFIDLLGNTTDPTTVTRFNGTTLLVETNVPEPGSLALLGTGLAGIGFLRRRLG